MPAPATPEAHVVRYADRIAYTNHDVADAVRAGVLREEDLHSAATDVLGHSHRERVNTLVTDLVASSGDGSTIALSEPVSVALDTLRDFLFERVYLRGEARSEQDKALGVIRDLYYRDPGEAALVDDAIGGMVDMLRVDFYDADGVAYFGECTVYPVSGLLEIRPRGFDFEWGARWRLARSAFFAIQLGPLMRAYRWALSLHLAQTDRNGRGTGV